MPVGITQLVLMCIKVSDKIFWEEVVYQMVVPRQGELPFHTIIGWHRGKRFEEKAQFAERTAKPTLWKIQSQLPNVEVLICGSLLNQKLKMLFEVEKVKKKAVKMVGRHFLMKQLGSGSTNCSASIVILSKSSK